MAKTASNLTEIGDVGVQGCRQTVELLGDRFASRPVPVHDTDPAPFLQEPLGGRRPNAAGTSGNQHGLVF